MKTRLDPYKIRTVCAGVSLNTGCFTDLLAIESSPFRELSSHLESRGPLVHIQMTCIQTKSFSNEYKPIWRGSAGSHHILSRPDHSTQDLNRWRTSNLGAHLYRLNQAHK